MRARASSGPETVPLPRSTPGTCCPLSEAREAAAAAQMAGKTALDTAVLAGPLTCIDKLDALRGLCRQTWLPPVLEPG